MLKMTLNEIRGQIQIYPENWKHIFSTNCYAYALGLDIRENKICNLAYQPGTISKCNRIAFQKYFTYHTLIESLEKDFEVLGINYREIKPNDIISQNEWKIVLCTKIHTYEFYSEWLADFHFFRENLDGTWSHKRGYHKFPSQKDYSNLLINNPIECDLGPYKYRKCYALKLK